MIDIGNHPYLVDGEGALYIHAEAIDEILQQCDDIEDARKVVNQVEAAFGTEAGHA